MTSHGESTGKAQALSSDSVRKVKQYQTVGSNARLKLFALLVTQGAPAAEADDLVAALEAWAVAGAQCEVVELDGMAPASRGEAFEDGWDEGVRAVSEALVGIADRDWSRRGGRSAGAAELAVHIADVRQRERADLVRLETFVRETVLPRMYPHTMARRRVLEALGEADRLCNARTIEYSTDDVILCTCGVGHYDPEGYDPLGERGSEGWHKCNSRTCIDERPYNYPHTAA
ncbi:hypothetical protein [Streptomyces sp. NBC_01669]|uniref:hypothetical protein n=1 Tax=Streptomyces sp. NBC_01669 TaxID=2975909 RepID=UPI002256D849|nr:hypothetical protein [Streptomyces sp. NBC_01669]MCX4539022.1 hypothetical protein [Streptomyces sp. NBC_01669]